MNPKIPKHYHLGLKEYFEHKYLDRNFLTLGQIRIAFYLIYKLRRMDIAKLPPRDDCSSENPRGEERKALGARGHNAIDRGDDTRQRHAHVWIGGAY